MSFGGPLNSILSNKVLYAMFLLNSKRSTPAGKENFYILAGIYCKNIEWLNEM
jgi:hypothetical protein